MLSLSHTFTYNTSNIYIYILLGTKQNLMINLGMVKCGNIPMRQSSCEYLVVLLSILYVWSSGDREPHVKTCCGLKLLFFTLLFSGLESHGYFFEFLFFAYIYMCVCVCVPNRDRTEHISLQLTILALKIITAAINIACYYL